MVCGLSSDSLTQVALAPIAQVENPLAKQFTPCNTLNYIKAGSYQKQNFLFHSTQKMLYLFRLSNLQFCTIVEIRIA